MAGATETTLRLIAEATDQKQAILDYVGDLSDYQVLGARVLVAIKPPRRKTKGGIHLTDTNASESQWTGNMGLLLKIGPSAFKYSGSGQHYAWEGIKPEVGQWVEFDPIGARGVGIRGLMCKYVDSWQIGAIVPDAEMVDDGTNNLLR